MHADVLDTHLHAYLNLREALGFQIHAEKRRLPEFVAYVHAHQPSSPIRAQMALEWAGQASTPRGPSGAARRLSMVRGFLRYLQASLPETEVPAPGLLPSPRRPKPFLFTPTQLTVLLEAAQTSRPRGSLRPHTLSSVLGLLASTGLRVGEALRLQLDHLHLDRDPPHLCILETKFHKSRLVPLHPSTAERLRHYQAQRVRVQDEGFSPAFFVSAQGQHLQHRALHDWFARLCQRVAITATDGGRQPCLTSLRHTFAVTRMQRWYQQGLDVHALLPHLSVYLGHIHPQESYWYLTAVPELLSAAVHRFETFAYAGGTRHA